MAAPWEKYQQTPGPWHRYADPPPDYTSDILETALPSLWRGANALAGMQGDVSQLARAGINKVFGQGTVAPQSPNYATSQQYQQAFENWLGNPLYTPKTIPGEIAGRALEYAPAAVIGSGTGGALGALNATVVPAAAGVGAREGAKALGMPQGVQQGADLVATLLAPYMVEQGVNAASRIYQRATEVPTTANLKASAKTFYDQAAATNTTVPDASLAQKLKDMTGEIDKRLYDLEGNYRAKKMWARMLDAMNKKEPITYATLNDWRGTLSDAFDKPATDPGGIGQWMWGQLTDFASDPANLAGPDAEKAVALHQAGNDAYNRYMKSRLLDQFYKQAEHRALANYTQAGEATGLKQKFRGLADKIVQTEPYPTPESRFYSPDDLKQIEDVLASGNTWRRIGKLQPFGLTGVSSIGSGTLVGGALGGPVGASIGAAIPPVAGAVGKVMSYLTTKGAANRAADFLRLGHALPVPLGYPLTIAPIAANRFWNQR